MVQLKRIGFILTVFFFMFISCANLRNIKLKENPEFEANAEKYLIVSCPTTPTAAINKYILKDQMNKEYEMTLEIEHSQTDVKLLEEEKTTNRIKTKTQEFTSHKFFIHNPLNNKYYEIVGKTTYLRTKEEDEKESFETGTMIYPLEFWIFDDGKDVGKIIIEEPGIGDNKVLRFNIESTLNYKNYHLEYQDMFNKVTLSFEDKDELIALISLKQKSFFYIG